MVTHMVPPSLVYNLSFKTLAVSVHAMCVNRFFLFFTFFHLSSNYEQLWMDNFGIIKVWADFIRTKLGHFLYNSIDDERPAISFFFCLFVILCFYHSPFLSKYYSAIIAQFQNYVGSKVLLCKPNTIFISVTKLLMHIHSILHDPWKEINIDSKKIIGTKIIVLELATYFSQESS